MKKPPAKTRLCAVFVDYDNIYLSLRRQDEQAAKQFPKTVINWLNLLQTGELISETGRSPAPEERRLVMCRCYGNPVPRRNASDNSTDIGSFPFVRHHFLRAGFDIVDCPPLTAQLNNSSDIRMVMDIQDFLDHKTHFDEFIILSGDADFAPILQRLRTHARHTTIYVNETTAAPYVALCDAQVQEQDLLNACRRADQTPETQQQKQTIEQKDQGTEQDQTSLAEIRNRLTMEIEAAVRASDSPVALAFLADKAQRSIGYEETVGSNWAGYGTFLNFLQNNLPPSMRITSNQPYHVVDERCHRAHINEQQAQSSEKTTEQQTSQPLAQSPAYEADALADAQHQKTHQRHQEAQELVQGNQLIRDTISQIHEHTHIPALAPSEYQILFEIISEELNEVGLKGAQTAYNISSRAKIESVDLTPEDAQFVLDIISEADPWFEKGISPPLFAERFMNAIVARCRNNGLHLTATEYDLVAAWFTGNTQSLQHQHAAAQLEPPSQQPTPWLLPNDTQETIREPGQHLRKPYIDPFNQQQQQELAAKQKELPRIFRFGSDG